MKRKDARLLAEELQYISEHGGATIFWITKTLARAKRIDYLEKCGAIVRRTHSKKNIYPWLVFRVVLVLDGFGSACPLLCADCGQPTMQVVRPGKFQCSEC